MSIALAAKASPAPARQPPRPPPRRRPRRRPAPRPRPGTPPLDEQPRPLVPQPGRMRRQQQRQLHRPQRHVRPLGTGRRPRPHVVQDPQHHIQRIGRPQHRRIDRRPRRPRHQHLGVRPAQHPPAVERIREHLPLVGPEPDHEVPGQGHPVHRGSRPPGHLQPHHRQQDRQPPAPHQHLVQQRGLQPLVVGGGAVEPHPLTEQFPQGDRPGPRPAGPVRQQPGQPVQLDLRGVQAGLVQLPVRLRPHQQAQRRQIGPLGPGLFGEPPPQLGGALGGRGKRGSHDWLVPSHDDRLPAAAAPSGAR